MSSFKGGENMKNALQVVVDQIGMDAVKKSVGTGFRLCYCETHGTYMCQADKEPKCPVCSQSDNVSNEANGTSATDVEHYINPGQELGTNPQQKLNPYGM